MKQITQVTFFIWYKKRQVEMPFSGREITRVLYFNSASGTMRREERTKYVKGNDDGKGRDDIWCRIGDAKGDKGVLVERCLIERKSNIFYGVIGRTI